jgi:ketosteroid isomerase-like protein
MARPLIEMQNEIIDMLREGQFVEGMERFYADDAVNEESTGARVEGKAAIIDNERKFLETVETYHGIEALSTGVGEDDGAGNGVTFAEYALRVDLKDGATFNPRQVQVTRWRDGLAHRITFYYDPAKL